MQKFLSNRIEFLQVLFQYTKLKPSFPYRSSSLIDFRFVLFSDFFRF